MSWTAPTATTKTSSSATAISCFLFQFQLPIISIICLRLLSRLPVPSLFTSTTCFRRRFLGSVNTIHIPFFHTFHFMTLHNPDGKRWTVVLGLYTLKLCVAASKLESYTCETSHFFETCQAIRFINISTILWYLISWHFYDVSLFNPLNTKRRLL